MAARKKAEPKQRDAKALWFDAIVETSLAVNALSERTDELQVTYGVNLTRLPDWPEVARHIATLKESMDRLDAGLAYSIAPEPFDVSHAAYKAEKNARRAK